MGKGREKVLIADASRTAAENDQLRAMVDQARLIIAQAQQETAEVKGQYQILSRLFAAVILSGEGERLTAKHRVLGNLPPACRIYKRDVDDTIMEFEVILTDERAKQVEAELRAANGDSEPAADATGNGDSVDGEEGAEGNGSSGRLVNQHGAPLVTD